MFPVKALESILEQGWNDPHPSNIGHDTHRPMGYSETLALHLQPSLARLIGRIWQAENEKDGAEVERLVQHIHAERIAEAAPEKCERLRGLLSGHLSADAVVRVPSCVAFQDDGLARRAFPAIFAKADKDGLIPLKNLEPVLPGVYKHGDLLLFAHQYFRRSLSRFNTLNEPFLERFQELAENKKLDLRIALDESLVGLAETLLRTIELQYWWGPKFTDELPQISLGVTKHGNTEFERVFNGVSRTEFWWYEQNERTFECEEVLEYPSLGISRGHFGCRFVHSIIDSKTDHSKHLDGAVRMYNEDAMLTRIDVDIMHAGRRSEYTKLWRVDEELDVPTWKALISDYFRDNHLVGEYFGGKEKNDAGTRPRTLQLDSTTASVVDFAPCTMARGDGVRIAISYHPIAASLSGKRVIEPANELEGPDGSRSCVEECTVDLVKLLRRRGETIEWPANTIRVAFEDFVFGLPLIAHCESDAVDAAQRTQDAIAEYCVALSRNGDDRMLGYHLGVRFADRDVIFSFAGHVRDLDDWFHSKCSLCLRIEKQSVNGPAQQSRNCPGFFQLPAMCPHWRTCSKSAAHFH